jgi:hypothetical protein
VLAIEEKYWQPLSNAHALTALAGLALLFSLIAINKSGFLLVLDHVNLAFHEAGHLIYGLLGSTLGLYGGTLGQLTIPITVAVVFLQNRDAVGFAVAGSWFFQNFLNIARYMADARAQVLPLVGGGDHDWANIFSRWGALSSDVVIATMVERIGWMGMIGFWVWLLWRSMKSSSFFLPARRPH